MIRLSRRAGAIAPALLLTVTLVGCAGASAAPSPENPAAAAADARTVTIDNCGTSIEIDTPPQRIVTVKSSTLELLLALGAGDRVVGSSFSDGPVPDELAKAAKDIPVISDKLPGNEAVLALEPDLIFAGWESNFSLEGVGERPALEKLGVTTYVAPAACKSAQYMPNPLTFDLVFDGFTEAGEIVGEQDAATRLVEEQREQLAAITPDDRELSTVWYSSGKDQPFVGTGIGAPAMIMSAAGLKNVFADVEDTWTSASWEVVADANPDIIVLVDAAWNTAESKIEHLQSNPVTARLDAVAENRFVIVDFPSTEAGIRNVEAVSSIVDQLAKL